MDEGSIITEDQRHLTPYDERVQSFAKRSPLARNDFHQISVSHIDKAPPAYETPLHTPEAKKNKLSKKKMPSFVG